MAQPNPEDEVQILSENASYPFVTHIKKVITFRKHHPGGCCKQVFKILSPCPIGEDLFGWADLSSKWCNHQQIKNDPLGHDATYLLINEYFGYFIWGLCFLQPPAKIIARPLIKLVVSLGPLEFYGFSLFVICLESKRQDPKKRNHRADGPKRATLNHPHSDLED